MEYALIQSGHKCIRVHASEYAKKYYYGYNSVVPLCPCCGSEVYFVYGTYQKSHFRHAKNSPLAKKCENYVYNLFSGGGSSSQLWNQATDFPYYLEKIGESFQLYLALPKITAKDIESLKNRKDSNIEISFSNYEFTNNWTKFQRHPIDALKADKHTLIPITTLALRYKISNIQITEVPPAWRVFGIFLPQSGTIFHIYDDAKKHRSIADDGQVYLHTPYYLVISDYQLPKTKNTFLKISTARSIHAKNLLSLNVYEIEFTRLSPDAHKFAQQLHVKLFDKPSELTLLWPPLQQENDLTDRFDKKKVSYFSKGNSKIYYALENPDIASNPFLFNKCTISGSKKTIESSDNKAIIPTTFYILDEGYSGYHPPVLDILWNNVKINQTPEITLEKGKEKSDLQISSDIDCYISYSQKDFVKYVGVVTSKQSFRLPADEIKSGDVFTIYHGKDIITKLNIRFKRKQPEADFDIQRNDLELYRLLRDKTDNYIIYPMQLKHILSKFSTYHKSYPLLKQALKRGMIAGSALKYMRQIMILQERRHGM